MNAVRPFDTIETPDRILPAWHALSSADVAAGLGINDAGLDVPPVLVHFEREFSGLEKPSGKELEMKKSRYTDEQIAFALKQAETGTPVAEVIRRMGISEQTFYRWKKVYGGLGVGELRRLKQLEDENRQLKQLVADLSLDKHILQDVLSKKL